MVHDWDEFGFKIPNILVPAEGIDYGKWGIIACDQYTSQPEYWEEVEKIVGDGPSAYKIMFPEIYLGGEDEQERIDSIQANMRKYATDGTLRELEEGCILVKRTAAGRTRYGLVIATDLEKYDFSAGSKSLTRATEGTIVGRIPPRLKIREGAPIEMPHIIILIEDPENTVIGPLVSAPQEVVYDADLMLDGGHITGSFIKAKDMEGARVALSSLYDKAVEKYGADDVIFQAVGDGNHSLATAKVHWEKIKKTLTPEEIKTHPARYALCEVENVHDEGIIFEAIHRVIFAKNGKSPEELIDKLVSVLKQNNGDAFLLLSDVSFDTAASREAFVIPCLYESGRAAIVIKEPNNVLAIAVLQEALDVLHNDGDCTIDYIHGESTVEMLSTKPGTVGFLLPAMNKFELFPAVHANGSLPRKTFSMGEANEKRYYMESKYIEPRK